MPYLQLDVPTRYPVELKRQAALRFAALYARIMQTSIDRVTVGFRELGEGNLWSALGGEPEPAAILMCDVRSGRPPEQRAELAQALIDICVELLGLRSDRLVVEFTQHTGDEMYRAAGGWGPDWSKVEAETNTSV
ncbi:hypothetical protein [Fimbriiglobus ruber]|uniref:Tautomerase n=1 Tax=Fimbriiglobus ruber TaxID=1908690 RepID=A0A225DGY8_9BACT|nr:hypothetical protein [Fimbriiglobus ruber]OWK40780.1 hypothetical protein FRUB_04672 [Fimbriiglobus ruber]